MATIVTAQLIALVAGYVTPHRVFGWQMFPESSRWQADIVRVERDGSRHDVRTDWPGGYGWGELVPGRLEAPFHEQHATYGLDATIDLMEAALAWVAGNTPNDPSTLRLEAEVTMWRNGRGPVTETLRSPDRPVPP